MASIKSRSRNIARIKKKEAKQERKGNSKKKGGNKKKKKGGNKKVNTYNQPFKRGPAEDIPLQRFSKIPKLADFVNTAKTDYRSFRQNIEGKIQKQIANSTNTLNRQLSVLQGTSNAAINTARSQTASSYQRMLQQMTTQRQQWDAANRTSLARIQQMESQVQDVPQWTASGPMDSVGRVSNPLDIFGDIGYQRTLSDTGKAAEVGFNRGQLQSIDRQNRGSSAFRTKRIAA